MITPGTAELALVVAKGLVKFGGRLDRLLAEKLALQSPLVLKLPAVDFSPGPNVLKPRLKAYLEATTDAAPGPLGKKGRRGLSQLLALATPGLAEMRKFFALAFPEEAVGQSIAPDAEFLAYLRNALPSLREALPEKLDPKTTDAGRLTNYQAVALAAAFYVDPGVDQRQLGYPVRVGLLVLDTVAEFGAQNTQLFVRDEGLRTVVKAVLEHFAEPDLESFDQWSPLLRHVLNATLNGVLDSRAAWQGPNPWLAAVLEALGKAREAAGPNGDNFLLGLLQGRGYPVLISQALNQAANVLDAQQAPIFAGIAADLLRAAAPLVVGQEKGFGAFFNEHWTDLVHAALVSLDKHGPTLLEGKSPLLKQVLLSAIKTLAETPGANLLTSDTAFHLVDTAVGALVAHPELWKNGLKEEWLAEFVSSVVTTVGNQGIQASFTRDGLTAILRDAAGHFSAHPEWIVKQPGLFQGLVGGVLDKLSTLSALDARTVAASLLEASLGTVAAHPELLETDYAAVIADFAGLMAAKVADHSLSALQAAEIAEAAATAALRHPELFADADQRLAALITNGVLRATRDSQTVLLSGAALVSVVNGLLEIFARFGADATANTPIGTLEDKLAEVLKAGLVRAREDLGRRLDLPALPVALGALVTDWLRGKLTIFDPGDPQFVNRFDELAEAVIASPALLNA